MPTSTSGLIIYDIVHYLWLAFPAALIYVASRPQAWWTPERARVWARIIGGMVSVPGVILVVMAIVMTVSGAGRAWLIALPGFLFFGLGSLVFKMKALALPVVSVLVALNLVRFMISLAHSPLAYLTLVWVSVSVAFAGQLLFIFYLYRMRQWGYFR